MTIAKNRVRWATTSLGLSIGLSVGLLFVFVAGTILLFSSGGEALSGLLIAAIIASVLAPFVALALSIRFGLQKSKRWAWYAGIVFFSAQIPTAWLPFGAAGLWGLLHPDTRAHFRAASKEAGKPGAAEYIAVVSAVISFAVILVLVAWVRHRMET